MKHILITNKIEAYTTGFSLFAIILMVIIAFNKPIMHDPFIMIFSFAMIIVFAIAFMEEFIRIDFNNKEIAVRHYLGIKTNRYPISRCTAVIGPIKKRRARFIYFIKIVNIKNKKAHESIKCDEEALYHFFNEWNKTFPEKSIDIKKEIFKARKELEKEEIERAKNTPKLFHNKSNNKR